MESVILVEGEAVGGITGDKEGWGVGEGEGGEVLGGDVGEREVVGE